MASGGMHYMMPYHAGSSVGPPVPTPQSVARLPDKHLVRAWAVDFLQWQLHQICWPNAYLLGYPFLLPQITSAFRIRNVENNHPWLCTTISGIDGCGVSTSFGMSTPQIREILNRRHDIQDLDESMDENGSVFTQHEESVGTPVSDG